MGILENFRLGGQGRPLGGGRVRDGEQRSKGNA